MRAFRVVIIIMVLTAIAASQTPPSNANDNPQQGGYPAAWPPGAVVNVYVSTQDYNSSQIAGIQQAFATAQTAFSASGVTFNVVVSSGYTPPSGPYWLAIQKMTPIIDGQPDFGVAAYASYAYTGAQNGTLPITSAYIQVAVAVADPLALEERMLHELGHTFGLGDCSYCNWGYSLMAYGEDFNATDGASYPSYEDIISVDLYGSYGDPYGGGDGCDDDICPILP